LACEVMIDGRAGEICTYRDRLESRCVITKFAENFARGTNDAIPRLRGLRRGRTSWTPGRNVRHGQIVPHAAAHSVTNELRKRQILQLSKCIKGLLENRERKPAPRGFGGQLSYSPM